MSTQSEIDRLRRVYASYEQNPGTHARWDRHNPGNQAIDDERRRVMVRLLGAHGLLPPRGRVLDVGSGSGHVLEAFQHLGVPASDLYGVDLLPDRIAAAQRRYPDIHFVCCNAEELPFPDEHFVLALMFTVIGSILEPKMVRNVAREATRVVQPGGAILWYDLCVDNPYNPHVRGVTAPRIAALFPGLQLHLQRVTLLPPLARRLGRMAPVLYPLLAALPFLCTHYLGLLIKPHVSSPPRGR